MNLTLKHGDCVERLKEIESNSVDAVICDPPYDIAFMSRKWDDENTLTNEAIWRECYRILKPGGEIQAFAATRTFHRLARTFKNIGFEGMRLKAFTYGSGFPKSTNISKQIDKRAKAERKVVGFKKGVGGQNLNDLVNNRDAIRTTDQEGGKGVGAYGTGAKQVAVDVPITESATPEAKLWDGYGTALKPAWEPIVVAKKPL
jgi:hypothetical protein